MADYRKTVWQTPDQIDNVADSGQTAWQIKDREYDRLQTDSTVK